MAATLRDIAGRLGLSTGLVSRVLNDKPGVWASEETRQRIQEVARELNYRPSVTARALVTGRTMQLAISTADVEWQKARSGRLAEVVGFIQAAAAHQYRVLVAPSREQHADSLEFDSLIRSGACDGFGVYAEQADEALYSLLRERNMPFVVIGNPGDPTLPQVDQDNFQYAYTSVRWLQSLGHRRIALAYPAPPTQPFLQQLEMGYRAAIEENGEFNQSLSVGRRLSPEERRRLLEGAEAPTAIIVCGVSGMARWRTTAASLQMRVPEDLTILAHIETFEEAYLQPGDAYHAHTPALVGEQAGELLIRWIRGVPPPLQPVLVPTLGPCWYKEDDNEVVSA